MTNTETLIGNMTASGPSLREWVEQVTGCDPITEPEFAWSNIDRCDGCDVTDSTVVIDVDGNGEQRLCFHCCNKIGVGPVS